MKNIEKDYYKKDVRFEKIVQKLDINENILLKGITNDI